MSLKFIEEFDNAASKTAPGSRGIGILNIFTVLACLIAVPFTFGTSLFGLLAVPIYAAVQSIANETYRTRLFTEIQTQIIAEKEGLFNTPRLRRGFVQPQFMMKNPLMKLRILIKKIQMMINKKIITCIAFIGFTNSTIIKFYLSI